MPVQVPRLNRISPQAPESVGRIDVDVPDVSRPVAQTANALVDLGEKALEVNNKLEDQAIDLVATKANSDYEVKYKTELQKAKAIEGDPTEAYSQFDQNSLTWEDEILKQYEGSSERTKNKIREKIARTNLALRDQRYTSEALQYSTFEKKTTDDAVKLRQEGILGSIELADAKDPDTFLSLEVQLDEIRKLRINSGRRNGLVFTDEKGNERLSPQLQMEIKKDLSDGLQNAIVTLNASGKTEEAAYLLERYKDDILADTRTKLIKGKEDSEIKNQALLAVDKVRFLDPDKQMSQLMKIGNLQVREKAIEIADANQRRLQNAKDRAAKDTYEDLAEYVNSKKFVSVSELRDDETYRRLEGRLKQSQRASLERLVSAPKNSDDKAKTKAYETMINGEFKGMSYGDFLETTAGLNQKDKAAFERKWKDANETTDVEKSKMVSFMGKALQNELYRIGEMKKDFGKFSPKSEKKYLEALDAMMETIDTFPPGTNQIEQQKWVKGFVADYIKGNVFKGLGEPRPRFKSAPEPRGTSTPTGTPAPRTTEEKTAMTREMKIQWLKKFYQVNGRAFDPKKDDLQKFYDQQKGKL